MASQLIASLDAEFDPSTFQDTYREKVMDLIERKAAGDESTVEAPVPVESNKVIDLMAALEASVKAAKEARGRHPSGAESSDADSDEDVDSDSRPAKRSKSAAKTGARKTAAKKTAAKSTKKAASKSTAKPAAAKKATRARKSA